MSKAKAARVIPFEVIERQFQLAPYDFFGRFCPAVDRNGDGYQIRILKSETLYGSSVNVTFDYFEMDADGTITAAPRGYAKDYKPGRVTGLDEAVAKYAEVSQ